MPKSKRAKVVHLSKVDKKGKEHKIQIFSQIRECLDTYQYCWVFSVENMRNTYLKDVRNQIEDSRLFFGKTKVMAKALGSSPSDEHLPNLSLLAPHVHGSVGLLFANPPPAATRAFFDGFAPSDFARAGTAAPRGFALPAGLVYSRGGELPEVDDVPVAHGLEPELRRLNVPTRLEKGKVLLENEFVVCREGDVLDSRQTRLLKLFGVVMAEFRVKLLAYWSAATQEVTEIEDTMDE